MLSYPKTEFFGCATNITQDRIVCIFATSNLPDHNELYVGKATEETCENYGGGLEENLCVGMSNELTSIIIPYGKL